MLISCSTIVAPAVRVAGAARMGFGPKIAPPIEPAAQRHSRQDVAGGERNRGARFGGG